MSFLNVSFLPVIILGFGLMLPSVPSAQPVDMNTEGGTQEVVVGRFGCAGPIPRPDDPVYGSLELNINGTSGILQSLEFYSELAPDSPAEICDAIAPEIAASARSMGCTVGRVSLETSPFNNRRNSQFSFVCDGRRNQVMHAIAGLAKGVIDTDTVVP